MLTYKAKLSFESDQDKQALIKVLEIQRDLFNFCSPIAFGLSKLSIVDLHRAFYNAAKIKFSTKSQFLVRAYNACLSAYRSIKSNKQKIDKPVLKKRLSITLDKRLYSYKNGIFRITTEGRRIKCRPILYPRLEQLLKYDFGDPTLCVSNNEIYICLPFKVPVIESTGQTAVGIDVGVRRFAATSDGAIYIDRRHNARKRKLRYLKRKLQAKKSRSAKRHLYKLRHKERHINAAFNHALCNKIMAKANELNADIFVLEKMNTRKIKTKRNRYQNKNGVSQISLSEVRRILTYKAALVGKRVVCVSPYYTSQIDCLTGELGKRQGCRFYGKFVYDADVNAAINIARRSEHPFSQARLLDGQAVVNQPIVDGSHSQARVL